MMIVLEVKRKHRHKQERNIYGDLKANTLTAELPEIETLAMVTVEERWTNIPPPQPEILSETVRSVMVTVEDSI